MEKRIWSGRWIAPDVLEHTVSSAPAPAMIRSFELENLPQQALLYLASGGYHELYINDQRPDDRVLAPSPSQFDKHVHYVVYDITNLLKAGSNQIKILLGNGWYDCNTATVWRTEHTAWRDTVKLCCDLELDGQVTLFSDRQWQWHSTPITFNELRNGESYDARLADAALELKKVRIISPPGGILVQEKVPPCRITQCYDAVKVEKLDSFETVYDFGVNISGVCEIEASGPAGAKLWIEYAEKIRDNGDIDIYNYGIFVKTGNFQRDTFTLKGSGKPERFRARFTYHGFRYAKVHICQEGIEVNSIKACFIHTDFAVNGTVKTSDFILSSLQNMTLRSYLSNFVGIPTDCPHREKNGWTGDALQAMETGLWNYDCADACSEFLQTVLDTQRPSGQLAAIAPTGIFGYNDWSGPAWDSVIFEYAYRIWLFSGKTEVIEQHYDELDRYLSYCEAMEEDNMLLSFGLGDWCCPEFFKMAPAKLTSSAYYFYDLSLMALFAELTKRDPEPYKARAAKLREAILTEFPPEKFDENTPLTSRAAMLYFNILPEADRAKQASALAEAVKAHKFSADFGILGAKWIPRALALNGYINESCTLFTQTEHPGWGAWVKRGETTLCECWNLRNSHNHIMFGDVSAWMYEFLGGIAPLKEAPGFERFVYNPQTPDQLNDFAMEYQTKSGTISSSWRREGDKVIFELQVPPGTTAESLLNGKKELLEAGKYTFCK